MKKKNNKLDYSNLQSKKSRVTYKLPSNRRSYSTYNSPSENTKLIKLKSSYIPKFVDAEGCFSIYIHKNYKLRLG
jgi:hypothetical protein